MTVQGRLRPPALRAIRSAQDGHCRADHVALTITGMHALDAVVTGWHLRRQRQLAGFSGRDIADAAGWSPTRLRQLEEAQRVTPGATARYLDGISEAWRVRATETAREEIAP